MKPKVSRSLVSLLVLLFLADCGPKRPPDGNVAAPPPPETREPSPPPPPDPGPLYERLRRHREAYAAGIELLAAGEELEGEERIALAANGLAAAAGECAAMEGCDLERFFAGYDRLLSEQGIAIKRQAARILELEASAEQDPEREPGTTSFVARMPEVSSGVSLLRGTDLRDLITLNGPVMAALDDWLTWMRPLLIESWENYQFLREKIAPIYEEAGLPEALLFAIMATETGGRVHSFSRAGAAGPLQFMRGTARRYGLSVVDGFDMRLDPEAAARASVAYLNDQLEAFDNSLEKALAAYNGGESRVERLHRRHREASLWDSEVYYSLPRETREYVPRVLAAAWLFLHPEEYDLEFPAPAPETTRLRIERETSIGELTICLGQESNPEGWFRTLRNLNPRLGPGDRIEPGEELEVPAVVAASYPERCLEGEILERARVLHDANYPDEPELVPYIVRRGDTLAKIAARHGCVSMRELAVINDIRPPRFVIRVGQRLKIPPCP